MNTSRGFLHITYKLYHHLNLIDGERKSHCLNVFLSVMKYAWKKNGYKAQLRHETIHKDTGLCRTTIKSCLETLNKLNIVKSIRGRSGKTYIVNEVFLKAEKLYEPTQIDVKPTQDSRFTPIPEFIKALRINYNREVELNTVKLEHKPSTTNYAGMWDHAEAKGLDSALNYMKTIYNPREVSQATKCIIRSFFKKNGYDIKKIEQLMNR